MTDRIIRKDGDRTAVQLSFPETGRTKQSFLDECDVNFIMNKWKRTGQLPPTHDRPASYGDFSNVGDYMQAKNSMLESDQAFAALPSWMRQRFMNDPAELIAFVDAPENLEEARKLGLVEPAPPEEGAVQEETTPEATPEASPSGTEGVTVTPP